MAIEPLPREVPEFDALVTEAVSQIPRLASAWTDHNVSDPGIMLIELLAAATEIGSFQIGRTDADRHRAFARLFHLTPAAPTAAEAVVQIHPENPASVGHTIASDSHVSSKDSRVFSTRSPLRLQAKQADPEIVCAGAVDASWPEVACFPFGAEPQVGASFTLRFAQPIRGEVSLYMWTGASDHDRDLRTRLIAASAEIRCETQPLAHYSAALQWESLAADGTWVPAEVVADDTRALTISGFVRLKLAGRHVAEDGMYPVRCRLVSGGYDCGPQLRRVLVNATNARHDRGLAAEYWLLGFGSGRAAEQFLLPDSPALFDSCDVWAVPSVELPPDAKDAIGKSIAFSPGEREPWRVVLSWDRTGPHDHHVLLDPALGQLTFGDGRVGWVPRAGHALIARCRYGGGSMGNVAAGSLVGIASAIELSVFQPFAALGGVDSETIDELRARLLEEQSRVRRAVSLSDIETLAKNLPGLPVAGAWALAEKHPRVPGLIASGCISLVIIPPCPDARPMPSQALLDAIAVALERTRPLTTQLIVTPPTYSVIAIAARLQLSRDAAPTEIEAQATRAIAEWIHPVRGGPGGLGWAPGRDLHRAEVMALLMDIPAIRAVDQFAFLTDGRQSHCESAPLCSQGLFTAGQHRLNFVQEV